MLILLGIFQDTFSERHCRIWTKIPQVVLTFSSHATTLKVIAGEFIVKVGKELRFCSKWKLLVLIEKNYSF